MAQFRVTSPDGQTYEVTAPEGATEQDAIQYIQKTMAPKAPETSALGAFATGLGQSAFGLGDEIEAGVRGAYDAATSDKSLSDSYNDNLKDVRARVDASADQHPVAYYGGELGGALAVPGGLARMGVQSAIRNAAGQGLRRAVTAGATEGAGYGAAYGFGKSEGGVQNRIEGTGSGALMGGTIGAAAPLAIGAVQEAARPVANAINAAVRPNQEAGRRILTARAADQQTLAAGDVLLGVNNPDRNIVGQRLIDEGRAGQELRNIDSGGENVRALGRSAANNSPDARELLNRTVNDRFEGQGPRIADFVRGLVPQGERLAAAGDAGLTRETLGATARAANRPLYQAAFRAGDRPVWSDTIERLTGAPMMREAMQSAAKRGQDRAVSEGFGAFNPGVRFDESGMLSFPRGPSGVPTYPNLQYWDQVKRELDDVANKAARTNAMGMANDARSLARSLRGELDAAVPEYAGARGSAAAYFHADTALEAGQTFARPGSHDINEVRRMVQALPTAERRLFTEGFISDYLGQVERTGDRRNLAGRLASSTAERQKLDVALGPNRARELEAFIHIEQLMDLPRTSLGNSTTARQLVELGLAGGAGMLASGGNIQDPTTWVVGAMTRYGMQRGQAHIDQRFARRIAEMLVSQDPQIMQRAVQQVAHHQPALNALRSASALLARGAPAASGAIAGGSMAQGQPLVGQQRRGAQ